MNYFIKQTGIYSASVRDPQIALPPTSSDSVEEPARSDPKCLSLVRLTLCSTSFTFKIVVVKVGHLDCSILWAEADDRQSLSGHFLSNSDIFRWHLAKVGLYAFCTSDRRKKSFNNL